MKEDPQQDREHELPLFPSDIDSLVLDPIADSILSLERQGPLESPEQHRNRIKVDLRKNFRRFQDSFIRVGQLLSQSGFEAKNLTVGQIQAFMDKIDHYAQEIVETGSTIREQLPISEEDITGIYEIANQFYSTQKYDEARDLFLFLTTVDPFDAVFWTGFAMTEQMAGHFEIATQLYAIALEVNPMDGTPALRIAYCLFQMNRVEDALKVLDSIIASADIAGGDDMEWQQLKADALAYREQCIKK